MYGGKCQGEVAEDDHAMQCGYCKKWYHIVCEKMSERKYQVWLVLNEYGEEDKQSHLPR